MDLHCGRNPFYKTEKAIRDDERHDKPFLVAENEDGMIVGFVFGGENSQPALSSDKELHALYVHPAVHGAGVGKALLYAFAKRMKQSGAKTFAVGCLSANKSLAFYQRMGGKTLCEINNAHFENLAETFLEFQVDSVASFC